MIRRALLGAALAYPLAAPIAVRAQSTRPQSTRPQPTGPQPTHKGFYDSGTKQRPVRFTGSDGVSLAGTLLLPIKSELQKVPGVVLVAGSGPTDRDGNNPLAPERIDLLKQLAELLAAAGIASLRYDKRGIGGSTPRTRGTLEDEERFVTWDHFVGDVVAAHAELVRHDDIKTYATALLGHSEGGLLALAATPQIAKNKPHALVLAATPGRPFGEILREQIARSAPKLSDGMQRIIASIQETGRIPSGLPKELEALFPAYAGPFLQRLLAFDPAKALAALDQPCLLLQGGADRQVVPMEDVQPLIDALGRRKVSGEAVVIPSVSHNLKLVMWPTDAGFGGSVAPAVASKLIDWLTTALGA
jgi:pimeloyl-ACP methyl ester carboxylesterase